MTKIIKVKNSLNQLVTKKHKGDDKLIIALVLIAVGVGLSIYFRNQIYDLITSAIGTLKTQVTSLFNGTVK